MNIRIVRNKVSPGDLAICRSASNKANASRIEEFAKGLIYRSNGQVRNRFPLHPQCLEASQYVYDSLAASLKYGRVEKQETAFNHSDQTSERTWTFENIFAEIKGAKYNNRNFMILAYYDTNQSTSRRWWSDAPSAIQGADNNASGTAIMLELAKMFGDIESERLDFDLQFVGLVNKEMNFSGKNDPKIIGSEIFIEQYMKSIPSYFNKLNTVFILDIVGHNPSFDRIEAVVQRQYSSLFDALETVNNEYSPGLWLESAYPPLFPGMRFKALKQFADINSPACLLTESVSFKRNKEYPGNTFQGTSGDTIDLLNFKMMAKLAKLLALSFAHLREG